MIDGLDDGVVVVEREEGEELYGCLCVWKKE